MHQLMFRGACLALFAIFTVVGCGKDKKSNKTKKQTAAAAEQNPSPTSPGCQTPINANATNQQSEGGALSNLFEKVLTNPTLLTDVIRLFTSLLSGGGDNANNPLQSILDILKIGDANALGQIESLLAQNQELAQQIANILAKLDNGAAAAELALQAEAENRQCAN